MILLVTLEDYAWMKVSPDGVSRPLLVDFLIQYISSREPTAQGQQRSFEDWDRLREKLNQQ